MNDPRQKDFDERHTKLPTVTALTKREYFAAMAMQGFLANPGIANAATGNSIEENDSLLAITSVRVADRVLKQLES